MFAAASRRQRITTIKETDMATLLKPQPARGSNVQLLEFFDACRALRVSPPIFESDEPGARGALVSWAAVNNLEVVDETLDTIGGRVNRVTRVVTHHHHHIDVLWTAPADGGGV